MVTRAVKYPKQTQTCPLFSSRNESSPHQTLNLPQTNAARRLTEGVELEKRESFCSTRQGDERERAGHFFFPTPRRPADNINVEWGGMRRDGVAWRGVARWMAGGFEGGYLLAS